MVAAYTAEGHLPAEGLPFVHSPAISQAIAMPTDFLGVNYYSRAVLGRR